MTLNPAPRVVAASAKRRAPYVVLVLGLSVVFAPSVTCSAARCLLDSQVCNTRSNGLAACRLDRRNRIDGPATIEEMSATTSVPPGWIPTRGATGVLHLKLQR